MVRFVLSCFMGLWKKTAWKSHLYIFFSREHRLEAAHIALQELQLPRRTPWYISLRIWYADICIVYIYMSFTRWNGRIMFFCSWKVSIFSSPWFSDFPQTCSYWMSDPSMRTVQFHTGFSPWLFVTWPLVPLLRAKGTWISCFCMLTCAEQQNMDIYRPCHNSWLSFTFIWPRWVFYHHTLLRLAYTTTWCGLPAG